jgi:hypothetical protein
VNAPLAEHDLVQAGIFIVIVCTQGMGSILVASIPEEKHDAA